MSLFLQNLCKFNIQTQMNFVRISPFILAIAYHKHHKQLHKKKKNHLVKYFPAVLKEKQTSIFLEFL